MEFAKDMWGLALLIICFVIVFIFFKDFGRIEKTKLIKAKKTRSIYYTILYRGEPVSVKGIEIGTTDLWFQRDGKADADHILLNLEAIPEEAYENTAKIWFKIFRDGNGHFRLKAENKKRLLIVKGDDVKESSECLLAEEPVVLQFDQVQVALQVQVL